MEVAAARRTERVVQGHQSNANAKSKSQSRVRFAEKPTYASVLVSAIVVSDNPKHAMTNLENGLASLDVNDESKSPLTHLKTKAETRASSETIQIWIVELPQKSAHHVLTVLKQSVEGQNSVDLQHLRRFAKARFLPSYLIPQLSPQVEARPGSSASNKSRSRSNSSRGRSRSNSNKSRSRSTSSAGPSTLFLLVCPVSVVSYENLKAVLAANPPFSDQQFPLNIKEITVPLFAPTTQEQADRWSEQYWPTIYRKSNPFGPHPTIITRAQEEVESGDGVETALTLAKKVAQETTNDKLGIQAGCVVIERTQKEGGKKVEVIAVAGDARFCGRTGDSDSSSCNAENPMAHAVMRAIGMVARKRVRVASQTQPSRVSADGTSTPEIAGTQPSRKAVKANLSVDSSLIDYPMTPSEQDAFNKDNLVPNGYLCVDLEMYLTHEPCVMCSMAILHSRFGRCVFEKRMLKTGALVAEAGLGYGLFWRPELNWKFLCWQYEGKDRKGEDGGEDVLGVGEDMQV